MREFQHERDWIPLAVMVGMVVIAPFIGAMSRFSIFTFPYVFVVMPLLHDDQKGWWIRERGDHRHAPQRNLSGDEGSSPTFFRSKIGAA